jgi:EpsI family protein
MPMISNARFLTVCLLLAVTSLYINLHADIVVPMGMSLEKFPETIGEWQMVSQAELDEETLNILKPTDYLSRIYEGKGGWPVHIYIGYHGGGKNGGEIHSPKHCLPGSGWYRISSERVRFDIDGEKINMVKALYQKGEVKELFYYWFQTGDRTISDEFSLKIAQIGNSILHCRRDAAFIRISVPVPEDEERSSVCGVRFIRNFYPVIKRSFPS